MEQTTIAVDKKTLEKLSVIAQKSSLTKTDIITRYVNALSQLISETKESSKISLTDFHIDLLHNTLSQQKAELYDISELPSFIQSFYALQLKIENGELSGKFYTKEELLKDGFAEPDIDILLDEQKKRFSK